MKRVAIFAMLILVPCVLFAQTEGGTSKVFTVKLGQELQAAQFGLDLGSLQPYIGVDYLAVKAEGSLDMDYMYPNTLGTGLYKAMTTGGSLDVSAGLLIPHAGLKYYFSLGESRPYVFADVFKAFPSIDASLEMSMTEYDENGAELPDYSYSEEVDLLTDDTKDFIKDILGFWGLDFGFGAEWRVNKHFGIAGEYGLKLFMTNAKQTITEKEAIEDDMYEDAYTETKTTLDISAALRMTQVAVCLNFYF